MFKSSEFERFKTLWISYIWPLHGTTDMFTRKECMCLLVDGDQITSDHGGSSAGRTITCFL